MRTPYELGQLAEWRRAGRSPALPVFVTDCGEPFRSSISGAGCHVISTRFNDKPEEWDWSSVSGLAVLLAFESPASRHATVIPILNARPRWLRAVDWSAPVGEMISAMYPL